MSQFFWDLHCVSERTLQNKMIEIIENHIKYNGKIYSIENFIHQIKMGIGNSFVEFSPICFCVFGIEEYKKYQCIYSNIKSAFEERGSGIRKCLNLNNCLD